VHSKDVVVVDDNEDMRDSVGVLLELEGFQVRLASNAAEALQLIEERRPGVMIVDMLLPGTSGLDLCRFLRRRPATAGIPILVYSGHPNPDHTDKGLYDLALTKSVEPNALVLAVETLLVRAEDDAGQRGAEAESPAT
jgi:DNA-binding response OmpR family regulator